VGISCLRRWGYHLRSKLPKETIVAKKSWIVKQKRPSKFASRDYTRCALCGRRRAYMRKFGLCRVCFRELALKGELPGVRKASW